MLFLVALPTGKLIKLYYQHTPNIKSLIPFYIAHRYNIIQPLPLQHLNIIIIFHVTTDSINRNSRMQTSKSKKTTKKTAKKTTKKMEHSFGVALDLDDQELMNAPPPPMANNEDQDFVVFKAKVKSSNASSNLQNKVKESQNKEQFSSSIQKQQQGKPLQQAQLKPTHQPQIQPPPMTNTQADKPEPQIQHPKMETVPEIQSINSNPLPSIPQVPTSTSASFQIKNEDMNILPEKKQQKQAKQEDIDLEAELTTGFRKVEKGQNKKKGKAKLVTKKAKKQTKINVPEEEDEEIQQKQQPKHEAKDQLHESSPKPIQQQPEVAETMEPTVLHNQQPIITLSEASVVEKPKLSSSKGQKQVGGQTPLLQTSEFKVQKQVNILKPEQPLSENYIKYEEVQVEEPVEHVQVPHEQVIKEEDQSEGWQNLEGSNKKNQLFQQYQQINISSNKKQTPNQQDNSEPQQIIESQSQQKSEYQKYYEQEANKQKEVDKIEQYQQKPIQKQQAVIEHTQESQVEEPEKQKQELSNAEKVQQKSTQINKEKNIENKKKVTSTNANKDKDKKKKGKSKQASTIKLGGLQTQWDQDGQLITPQPITTSAETKQSQEKVKAEPLEQLNKIREQPKIVQPTPKQPHKQLVQEISNKAEQKKEQQLIESAPTSINAPAPAQAQSQVSMSSTPQQQPQKQQLKNQELIKNKIEEIDLEEELQAPVIKNTKQEAKNKKSTKTTKTNKIPPKSKGKSKINATDGLDQFMEDNLETVTQQKPQQSTKVQEQIQAKTHVIQAISQKTQKIQQKQQQQPVIQQVVPLEPQPQKQQEQTELKPPTQEKVSPSPMIAPQKKTSELDLQLEELQPALKKPTVITKGKKNNNKEKQKKGTNKTKVNKIMGAVSNFQDDMQQADVQVEVIKKEEQKQQTQAKTQKQQIKQQQIPQQSTEQPIKPEQKNQSQESQKSQEQPQPQTSVPQNKILIPHGQPSVPVSVSELVSSTPFLTVAPEQLEQVSIVAPKITKNTVTKKKNTKKSTKNTITNKIKTNIVVDLEEEAEEGVAELPVPQAKTQIQEVQKQLQIQKKQENIQIQNKVENKFKQEDKQQAIKQQSITPSIQRKQEAISSQTRIPITEPQLQQQPQTKPQPLSKQQKFQDFPSSGIPTPLPHKIQTQQLQIEEPVTTFKFTKPKTVAKAKSKINSNAKKQVKKFQKLDNQMQELQVTQNKSQIPEQTKIRENEQKTSKIAVQEVKKQVIIQNKTVSKPQAQKQPKAPPKTQPVLPEISVPHSLTKPPSFPESVPSPLPSSSSPKKIVEELVELVKTTNRRHLNSMKERLLMMKEDIRSSLIERQEREKMNSRSVPDVHYQHILHQNIELRERMSSGQAASSSVSGGNKMEELQQI